MHHSFVMVALKKEIVKMANAITEKGLTVRDVEQQSENVQKKHQTVRKPKNNEYTYVYSGLSPPRYIPCLAH